MIEYIKKGVFLTDLLYSDNAGKLKDPDAVSKKLIENIH